MTDTHLKEHDKSTLLEYIASRFVTWDKEKHEIETEIAEELLQRTDDEIERFTEGELITDPTLDPAFRFHLRHPFPGTKEIASRLLNEYGIVTPHVPITVWIDTSAQQRVLRLSSQGMSEGSKGDNYVASKEYELVEETRDNVQLTTKYLQVFRSTFSIQWSLSLYDDYDPMLEAPLQYRQRTGEWPTTYQDIPGISMPELATDMCEFLVLSQVEEWVRMNLPKVVKTD